ncbi:hypothetical protein IMSAGC020_02393 [Lachnospiraceae bacterium]|nr:hypothetical protein IMSAGC020_02393 [Lachnospiraceae bacterium]
MTDKQLKVANEKMEEIQELEQFIRAFKEPYMNCIRASAFGSNSKDCSRQMLINSNSVLHNLILDHCKSELERLKEEFKNI